MDIGASWRTVGARQRWQACVDGVVDDDPQVEFRIAARQQVGDVLGLFGCGLVVQRQSAELDVDVPDSAGWAVAMRLQVDVVGVTAMVGFTIAGCCAHPPDHRGFVTDGTTRPASMRT